MTTTPTPTNRAKVAFLEKTWQEMLLEALKHGFYGSVSVEIQVQDGTIQSIRKKIEQVEK